MIYNIFSYGTLQDEKVQLETFNRKLSGYKDALVGYKTAMIKMTDAEVIRISGKEYHPTIIKSGGDKVRGAVFKITEKELVQCDSYEKQYVRTEITLESGTKAFVYIIKNAMS